ncbi:hypothetical protein PNIG_a2509 [Pseudoalteromonas nigrifaciens]|uniref:Tetratricopeptide repeat protein n=1 Tax=Pseudoalteromonas nigrifaciens TaxID=28109 RepID=A0AAC9UJP8_9GAMM|nr:hypothetical protein [Pseudoalteromonas nigrifaciens]ASM54519.1 hypothetical protein PNIG_a2509 [Pseudoalteromonas nigrifaciens]GEN44053.1 hypothetical protein PNI02_35190 [Pseudoalteromonas nigrifaciens]SUC51659.1 Tetratricopeptide repeat [Pseudoalteromonas nigrifaciens]
MSLFSFFSRIKTDPKAEAQGEQYFRQALQYHQYGNQDDAILFFTKSLEVSPHHSSVFLNRAGCFMIQERYLEAYDDYRKVIDMEKNKESVDIERATSMALQNIERIKLFISFEKKSGDTVRQQLSNDGLEYFAQRWAEILSNQHLANDLDLIKYFILEEIKELEEMGGIHQEYALNCGINHSEFIKVTENNNTGKAFIFFKSILCCFSRDPLKMFKIRTAILNKLISLSITSNSGNNISNQQIDYDGGMRLIEAEVDIMFIVKNGEVMYVNNETPHLYEIDKDGDMKLDGRVVNFIFKDSNEVIEIFVAFDDQDSYSMFTMNMGRDERLNYVAQAIFQFMGQNNITNVFSATATYSSQYHYPFKLYKKNDKHFMVNNSQSQAYLISENIYKNNNADDIKSEFWGMA